MTAPLRFVLVEKKDCIAKVTLNRPERLNALAPEVADDLVSAITDVSKDDSVGVVIFTGAGRAFCSGGDIKTLAGGEEKSAYSSEAIEEIRRGFEPAQAVILGIQRMEKPTIAMVNGAATGAGMDIAFACDMRIGGPATRFASSYIKIGLFPGWGGTWLLPRVIGLAKAAEMVMTGDAIEAEEALRIGALNKLVPAEQLETAVMELAKRLAAGPPIALRLAKLNLYKGLEIDLETAMKFAAASETITLSSQDHREGAQAFREKRSPKYTGR